MTTTDAVVVGAGPNGLVAANMLVDAGWSVVLLESQDEIGGAVKSAEDVHPGFVHDTFSSFYPMSVVSPAMRAMELERYGVTWTHAEAVVGTPFRDGSWMLQHRDAQRTADGLDAHAEGDGAAYLELVEQWHRAGGPFLQAMLSPFPPVKHGLGLLARLPRAGGASFVRTLLSPLRTIVEQRFRSDAAQVLFAGNAVHADIPMDSPGSGLLGLILVMLGATVGYPVPEGGAGRLSGALGRRFTERGGEIVTGARAVEVLVRDRRATGVRTQDGTVHEAGRAVLTDVPAPALYGGLVGWEALPARSRRAMERFEWDPGTIKVDWALSGPVPWQSPPPSAPGTVHLAESVGEVAQCQTEVLDRAIPRRPFLLVGQMATTDPTRAPAGQESLWAYTHVPHETRRDAGADLPTGEVTGAWDHDDAERMADRMQARLEEYAPDLASRIIARRVLGPRELEERDESLVGGALNGGTAALQQELVFRPGPGLGRAETPVRGLYLASASAHPGGSVHGAAGANAARAAVAHDRLRRLTRR